VQQATRTEDHNRHAHRAQQEEGEATAMVTSIYLTILIAALVVLAHLALLYLVIRLAITHALTNLKTNSRHAAEVFDKR
jgi:hypothetical protein